MTSTWHKLKKPRLLPGQLSEGAERAKAILRTLADEDRSRKIGVDACLCRDVIGETMSQLCAGDVIRNEPSALPFCPMAEVHSGYSCHDGPFRGLHCENMGHLLTLKPVCCHLMANKLVRSDGPVLAMRAMDADVHNCRAFAVAMAIPMWREWWGTPLEDPKKHQKRGQQRRPNLFRSGCAVSCRDVPC